MNNNCNIKICYNKLWLMPLSHQELHAIIQTMLKVAPSEIGSFLHINIVDDATIAGINEDYLHCSGPTNIISFPAEKAKNAKHNDDMVNNNAMPINYDVTANSDDITDNYDILNSDDIANIFLSIDTFHRECFLYKQEPIPHLLWLFAHAMGHLCHLDHSPEMDKVCSTMYNACL